MPQDDDENEPPTLSQDGFAVTMPGYDDDAEGDPLAHTESLDAEADAEDSSGHARSTSVKPKSSSTPPFLIPPQDKASSSKVSHPPRASPAKHNAPADDLEPPLLECPICGRMLDTDNQGLNEHIDFCLSKQAIKEAQTASLNLKPSSSGESSGQTKKTASRKPQARSKAKPDSSGHGEGLLRYRNKG